MNSIVSISSCGGAGNPLASIWSTLHLYFIWNPRIHMSHRTSSGNEQ